MSTLVLQDIPDDLYQRLKETAAAHHRSVVQEAIITLTEALVSKPQEQAALKPTWEAYASEMKAFWGSLPADDSRTPDEIIGYDKNGLPG